MGRVMTGLLILFAGVVIAFGYVRLAPSDPVFWHKLPEINADKDFKRGVIRVVETGPDGLARLSQIATESPRTKILAGSIGDGMITFVTRTRVVGFPDYTTVQQDGPHLKIYARSRFGRSDLGVNRNRVEAWIAALQS
ncbi:DUF1499 domain-containing protein [Aliisedimentitalea scapharcae]|uniref:DUF1499 domain-containing protein n=1 Tax=Aliisedimentitalea scapharcae TaxID=1524259 RepID=A0ABZ2XN20_9RHOB